METMEQQNDGLFNNTIGTITFAVTIVVGVMIIQQVNKPGLYAPLGLILAFTGALLYRNWMNYFENKKTRNEK